MCAATRTDHVYILIWVIKGLSQAQTRNVLFNFLIFFTEGGPSPLVATAHVQTQVFLDALFDFEFGETEQTEQTCRCRITMIWQAGRWQWGVPAPVMHSLTFEQLLVILLCL